MEIKDIYQKMECSKEDKEKIYRAILQKRRRNFAGSHFMKAAVIVLCLLVGGTTAYAAVHLLTANEAAEQMGNDKLAKEFAGLSEQVVTKKSGDYKISYLGKVSGKKLLDEEINSSVSKEKSYYVVAVENTKKKDERMIASPFVKGKAPWQYNLFIMGGSSESQLIDGIRYYIYECDNLDIFANYGVYLGVSDQTPGAENFCYDKKTGEISVNPKYKGVSVLFEVSLDKTKANEDKAQEAFKMAQGETQSEDTNDTQVTQMHKIMKKWNELPEQKRIQFAKENGMKTKEETVYNENYAEKIGKEFIPGNSYTEKYLDIKVAVLVKKKTAKITHYQVSLDEVKALFS